MLFVVDCLLPAVAAVVGVVICVAVADGAVVLIVGVGVVGAGLSGVCCW